MPLRVLILAAGKGKRMKSSLPKVAHKILNKPMINYVVDAAYKLKPRKIGVVVGYGDEIVRSCINKDKVDFITQKHQLGTGHAVSAARSYFKSYKGDVLILNGDCPAISSSELRKFLSKHSKLKSKISLISATVENPRGYGRICRTNNKVTGIIEEKDATSRQKQIEEINSGIYCVNSDFLWNTLRKIKTNNAQKEYYLPDIVKIAVKSNIPVMVYRAANSNEVLGVNSRYELSRQEKYLKSKVLLNLMKSGVTVVDDESTFISPDATIGADTIVYPNSFIFGATKIGRSCTIGPNAYIEDSTLGKNVELRFSSYLNGCRVENDVRIGPFAHIRPDAHIASSSKIGNFVEIKKSRIGKRSKVPHLTYVGDAIVGQDVNIGAGTITCNYDGKNKHQTIIEDEVFIGSDSMLVAPVRVGRGATTAAGSTITKDVENDSLAIERGQQKNIKGWRKRKRK